MHNKILYLQRSDIDIDKWNTCIRESSNGLVYGYSFYLDAMATNWDALVLDDYTAVMPLPWRKKWGIYYLYQPFLTAQLGVFGNSLLAEITEDFLKHIPLKFRLWEFPLNAGNHVAQKNVFISRKNYVLPLHSTYEKLYGQYKAQTKRNIKKGVQQNLVINRNTAFEDVSQLVLQNAPINNNDKKYLHRFGGLYGTMNAEGTATTYGVYAKDGKLLSSAVFLFSHNRAYYLLVGNHPDGRSYGASHYLVDAFIKDHADSSLILDFEGSDIESLAFFYSSFGAVQELYPAVKFNRLPFYLRWLKK